MASEYTPNRRYPLYTDQDKPNLRDQYNQAIREIDTDMKQAIDDSSVVASALGSGFSAQHTVADAIENVTQSISDEETARQNADNVLSQSIADEATARQNADNVLSQSIADEKTARQNADNTINTQITNINSMLQHLEFSVSDVRHYGAKEKDPTINWNSIIDQITKVSDCVYFPAGEWYVSSRINISGVHTVIGCGAKLVARQSMNAIIMFTPATNQTGPQVSPVSCVDGIFFDGNSLAVDALQIVGANARVSNCRFLDYTTHGIFMTSLGLDCINCQFGEDSAKFSSSCIGIRATTDCHITACKFFGQKTCIQIGENTEIVNCLFYPGDDNAYRSTAIASYKDDYFARAVSALGCEFDTMGICFCDIGGNVIGNNFYWNTKTSVYHAETFLFAFKTRNVVEDTKTMNFSDNTFVMPYLDGRVFHTFGALETGVSSYASYVSENISLRIQDEAMPYTYIFFGLNRAAKNAMYATPQGYVGLFTASSGFADAHLCAHLELSNRGAQLGMGCFVSVWDTDPPHYLLPARAIVISMVTAATEKMYVKQANGSGPIMLMPYTPASISRANLATNGTLEYRFFPASQRDSLISTYALEPDSGHIYSYREV